jgi:hypothetical protein
MLKRSSSPIYAVLAFTIVAAVLAGGCGLKHSHWGSIRSGLILVYLMMYDDVLEYEAKSEFSQALEVGGQTMEFEMDNSYTFSIEPRDLVGKNHRIDITINSMKIDLEAPIVGRLSPDVSSIVGKSFEMILSPMGKEVELLGAESLRYSMGPSGERSVASSFQAIFPDLPGRPVKIGDAWTSQDTINIDDDNTALVMALDNSHVLAGFETVNGMECAKVTTDVTGSIGGKGEQQGVGVSFSGEVEGTDVWYFAYKEGVFVKSSSDATIDLEVNVSDPSVPTIPMHQEMKVELALIR